MLFTATTNPDVIIKNINFSCFYMRLAFDALYLINYVNKFLFHVTLILESKLNSTILNEAFTVHVLCTFWNCISFVVIHFRYSVFRLLLLAITQFTKFTFAKCQVLL